MPNPPVHAALAFELADRLGQPVVDRHVGALLLGATAPDIRAMLSVDREHTHFSALDSTAIDAGVDTAGRSVQYDVALLKATAWETARMTQVIIHMDYDAVADLSGIYEVQGLYARMTDDFVEIMLRQERPSSVSEVREMYRYHTGYISNLAKLGKQLRGEYDRFLQLSE